VTIGLIPLYLQLHNLEPIQSLRAGGAALLSIPVGEQRALLRDAVNIERLVTHHALIGGAGRNNESFPRELMRGGGCAGNVRLSCSSSIL
jgi:hypothetical protein